MQYRLEKSVFIPDSAVEIETDERSRLKPGATKKIFFSSGGLASSFPLIGQQLFSL